MAETEENRTVLLISLIVEILLTYGFPLAMKLINTLTSKEDITLEMILELKKKVPTLAELEAQMGITWPPR